MVHETTTGLRADGTAAEDLQDIQWAVAAGTVSAITAVYGEPNTTLPDGLILGFRASGANTSATPTFAPDGLTARTIVKRGGVALLAGDIPGALAECLVRYNLANTRWELLNPASGTNSLGAGIPWAVAAGTVQAITVTYAPAVLALTDGLILGFRASGANTASAPTFSPNGLTARAIVRRGGNLLLEGSIVDANMEVLVRYDLTNTRWEMLNPDTGTGSDLYKYLTADVAATDVATAQPWFPSAGSVVLDVTNYKFVGLLMISRAAGANSHTTAVLFGGTATLTEIIYLATCKEGDANDLQDISGFFKEGATAHVVKAASTSTTEQIMIRVEGFIRASAAGTLIPQFQYSAAPGGTPTVLEGTFFHLTPLRTAANPTRGTWA